MSVYHYPFSPWIARETFLKEALIFSRGRRMMIEFYSLYGTNTHNLYLLKYNIRIYRNSKNDFPIFCIIKFLLCVFVIIFVSIEELRGAQQGRKPKR